MRKVLLFILPLAILALMSAPCWAHQSAMVRVFKGCAVVKTDESSEVLQLSSDQNIEFGQTVQVSTAGPFASISVDFGDNGFVRVDYGRADITLSSDGTVRVHSYGASVYVDADKVVPEGRGRWAGPGIGKCFPAGK